MFKTKILYLLNELRSFNEIFRKDVTYGNIKSQKNQDSTLSLKNAFFGKTTGGVKFLPPSPPPAILGLA